MTLTAVPDDPADPVGVEFIDRPMVVLDMPDDVYHADPVVGGSLSSTGVRRLLPPHCPQYFRHWADHPQPPKVEFDLGKAAHRMALGVGADLAVLQYDDYRSTAARAERDAMYAAGVVPLLAHQADEIEDMVKALYAHPLARRILGDPPTGVQEHREASVFWADDAYDTGGGRPLMRRARLDWVRPGSGASRPLVVDYKTRAAGGAHPLAVERAMWDFGWHVQGEYYRSAVAASPALQGDSGREAGFVLLVQERIPPYLVTVAEPDPDAALWARRQIRAASRLYAECSAAGMWPGYADDEVVSVGLPGYAAYDLEAQVEAGHLDTDQ